MSTTPRPAGDTPPLLDWAVASRPRPGERISGDAHLVEAHSQGLLVAVVDGVGHGDAAALAASRAVETMRAHRGKPLVEIVQLCHRALAETRGAVMSLAAIDCTRDLMLWVAVGNVEGALLRATAGGAASRRVLLQRGGLVGCELPQLEALEVPLMPGDVLAIATDGIDPGFVFALDPREAPRQLAAKALAGYARDSDDGLVLVARYGSA